MAVAVVLLALACAAPPQAAFADEGDDDEGDAAFAVYSADDNSLTFYCGEAPEVGDTYNGKAATGVYTAFVGESFDAGDAPWNEVRTAIYTVEFDESFAAVQPTSTAYWFYNLTSCSSIDLNNLDTSQVTSMEGMFYNCAKLSSLEGIGDLDTSNVKTLCETFYCCSSLVEPDLSGWDVSNVTTLEKMFYGCTALVSFGAADWDVSGVTTLEGMLYGCTALASFEGESWDVSNATNLKAAFRGCGLVSVDLSAWDTSKVTNLCQIFFGCTWLTEVDISDWDTSNVTNMEEAFQSCLYLVALDLSGWDTSKVASVTSMFQSDFRLETIYVGDGWSMKNVEDGEYMFYGCRSLVGGNGTAYDSDLITYAYACIDTDANPGYLTDAYGTSIELGSGYYVVGGGLPETIDVIDAFGDVIEGVEATVAYYADEDCTEALEGAPSSAGIYWAQAVFDGLGSYKASESDVVKITVVLDFTLQEGFDEFAFGIEWVFGLTEDDVSGDGASASVGTYLSFTPWVSAEYTLTLASSLGGEDAAVSAFVLVLDADGNQMGDSFDLTDGSGVFDLTAGETYYVYVGIDIEGVVGDYVSLLAAAPITEYVVAEGDGQAIAAGGDELAVTVEAELSDLVEVRVDGAVVSESDYSLSQSVSTVTVTRGSYTYVTTTYYTIATLSEAYLATLEEGEHTLNVVFDDGWSTSTFTVFIPIDIASVSYSVSDESFVYDGSAQSPTFTAEYEGAVLVEGTDYVIACEDNIEAGTATVTVTGIGSYTGSITFTFEIAKAEQALSFASESVSVHVTDEVENALSGAQGTVEYGSSDESVAIVSSDGAVTIVGAGTVTITATASATDNYEAATASYELTVTGHSYVAETLIAASCESAGVVVYTCGLCGDTYTELVAATGHSYDDGIVTDPTCDEDGYTTYTCTVCGDVYTADEVAALGHTEGDAVIDNEVAATCTLDGSYDTVVYCTVCGQEMSRETVVVAAVGHSYDAIATEPTCTDDGSITYVCTVCGDTYTEAIAATGHTWGSIVIENVVAATCTEAGSYELNVYCTVCGELVFTQTMAIEAIGHDYEAVVTTEATATEDGVLTYTCAACGDSYTQAIPATGEADDDEDVTIAYDTFSDVQNDALSYYEPVYALVTYGYMTGLTSANFGIGQSMTREQLVTVLWRIACPEEYAAYVAEDAVNMSGLSDVKDGKYYTAAIAWGVGNGVINGYADGTFGVGDPVTFEQFCVILSRCMLGGNDALEASMTDAQAAALLSGFTDAGDVGSAYDKGIAYLTQVVYDTETGAVVVGGNADGSLDPKGNVTRERVATVLYRVIEAGLLG